MGVTGFDHLVLTVASLERTIAFYEDVLGMRAETFAVPPRHALRFGPHKINLHQVGAEFEPKAHYARPGTADLCLLVDDLEAMLEMLKAKNIAIIEGPVSRTGARGRLRSVYIRDPDRNLIELSIYEDGKANA